MELKQIIKEKKIDKKKIAEMLDISVPSVYRILDNPEQHADRIEKIRAFINEDVVIGGDLEPATKGEEGFGEISFDGKTLKASVIINTNPANMTLDEIRDEFELNEQKWRCDSYKVKSWNTTMKNKEMEPMVVKNYSIAANFKQVNNWMVTEADIEWIKETLAKSSKRVSGITVPITSNESTLVLPIYDGHIGKYAYGKETGEDYNHEIARNRILTAVKDLVERGIANGITRIIFPVGQDLMHVDNLQKNTTAGTPQDVSGHVKQIYDVALQTMVDALNICADSGATVEAFYCPGNHDTLLSYTIVKALAGHFKNDERVSIEENASQRYYIKVGKNLLGFSHGAHEKARIFEIMQQEAREMWGETEYSEWIVGHTHDEKVESKMGVKKRTIGTIAGHDTWTYNSGYVGSLPIIQAPIYNPDIAGPFNILFHNSKQGEIINGAKQLTKTRK